MRMYYTYFRILTYALKFFLYSYLTEQVMQEFWMFRRRYIVKFWFTVRNISIIFKMFVGLTSAFSLLNYSFLVYLQSHVQVMEYKTYMTENYFGLLR